MPEHLKALCFIMAIALPILWLGQRAVGVQASQGEYALRRNAWIAVTLLAFLAHDYWLYIILLAVLSVVLARRSHHALALYLVIVTSFPPFEQMLPGFGPINNLLAVSHQRVLGLFLLLPAALLLARRSSGTLPKFTDGIVLLFMLWMLGLQATQDSITQVGRSAIYLLTDAWLPYFVASRTRLDRESFREIMLGLAAMGTVIGALAVFEAVKFWLLYESLRQPLGIPAVTMNYLMRAGSLRAAVSTGQAIVAGYLLMICLIGATWLYPALRTSARLALFACISGGLIATLSRGPWVGAAAGLAALLWMAPGLGKRVAWLVAGAIVVGIPLLMSPLGDSLIAYLPFVGSVENENIQYRARLWDVSLAVLAENPLTGNLHYLRHPLMEQMRQGQGIIDMVNTYLLYAMPYGIVGLVLFCTALWLPLLRSWWRARELQAIEPEGARAGRVLVAMSTAAFLTIATVSNIGIIAPFCWIMAGLCASYGASGWRASPAPVGAAPAPARRTPARAVRRPPEALARR